MGEPIERKIDTLQRDVDQKIDYFQRDVDQKFGTLQKDVNDLKVETAAIKGEIKTLDQKVEGMDKRLEKVEDNYAILVRVCCKNQSQRETAITYQMLFFSSLFTGRLRRAFGNTEKLPTSQFII